MKRVIKFRAYTEISNEVLGMKYDVPHNYNDTVMQFTGLLDRNGKEIYELDIVRTFYGKIAVVMYLDGSFKLFTNTTDFKPIGTVIGQNVEENYLGYFFQENIEIIGNIYENPELLQDSTKGVIL